MLNHEHRIVTQWKTRSGRVVSAALCQQSIAACLSIHAIVRPIFDLTLCKSDLLLVNRLSSRCVRMPIVAMEQTDDRKLPGRNSCNDDAVNACGGLAGLAGTELMGSNFSLGVVDP